MKANNINVNLNFLSSRAEMAMAKGYSKQKWIIFCEVLLAEGFVLRLYEARKTFSKYITVKRGKRGPDYKVRFSNHRPIKAREARKDCDFFVGVSNFGTTTTEQALVAVREFFAKQPVLSVVVVSDGVKRPNIRGVCCLSCRWKFQNPTRLLQHLRDKHDRPA